MFIVQLDSFYFFFLLSFSASLPIHHFHYGNLFCTWISEDQESHSGALQMSSFLAPGTVIYALIFQSSNLFFFFFFKYILYRSSV